MIDWFREHQTLVWTVAGGVSLATFVGSLVLIPWLIAQMPADYFLYREPSEADWRRRHPALRLAIVVAKNIVGALLLVAGVAMLVLPGQGLLSILMGLVLLDYPGKRRLERSIIRRRVVRRAVGWIRKRAGRAPFELPEVEARTNEAERGAARD